MHNIALIPARGGSKGIPGKNIALLAGKPLIAYAVEQALATPAIHRVIVSTDDETIAKVAEHHGAEVPFLRPRELAGDAIPDFPVFDHARRWLQRCAQHADIFVHLRPTTPFRTAALISACIEAFYTCPGADSLRTVSESPITPYKLWQIEKGRMKPFVRLPGTESYNMPRQQLPRTYWHNGVIDIIAVSTLVQKHSVSGDFIIPFVMDDSLPLVDIDTPADLQRAEWFIQQRSFQQTGS